MKISATLKVGILTILSTCILVVGIMWLKGRSISIDEKIEVHFKDIDGMRPGSAVQMMGMRIGQVDEIEPVIDGENSYMIVRFVINVPGVKIPLASKISIQQSGIIGEKFLEVTPPFSRTVFIPMEEGFDGKLPEGGEVELLIGERYVKIGHIKESKIIDTRTLSAERRRYYKSPAVYKVRYYIDIPDIEIPMNSNVEITGENHGKNQYRLRFIPPEGVVVNMPQQKSKYTIEEPMRMKEFLDFQLESAKALKETNDKINELFTDEFMEDIRYIVENTRDITDKASFVANQIAILVDSSKDDIQILITSSARLAENMTVLSETLNDVMGDSGFKENLITTVNSIRTTSDNFSTILSDSKIQESLLNINATTEDLSEISSYVNALTKDAEFNAGLGETIVNLNQLMIKLTRLVDTVDGIAVEEEAQIKEILTNSHEISKDLKKFSDRLNQRFLLLRLLF